MSWPHQLQVAPDRAIKSLSRTARHTPEKGPELSFAPDALPNLAEALAMPNEGDIILPAEKQKIVAALQKVSRGLSGLSQALRRQIDRAVH